MKNYKGLYHNDKSIIPCYEHGAHFKYLDLVNALKELQEKYSIKNDKESLDLNFSSIQTETVLIKDQIIKPKKFKLKSNILNTENNDNKRYKEITYLNENEENNEDIFIKEPKRIKRLKGFSKSIDRKEKKLPKINIYNSNSISLRNKSYNPHRIMERIINNFDEDDNNNEINNEIKEIEEYNSKLKIFETNTIQNQMKKRKLNKSKKFIKSIRNHENFGFLPKIQSFHHNYHTKEEQNKKINMEEIEEEPKHLENENFFNIKNSIDTDRIKFNPIIKKSHKGLSRLFLNDLNNKNSKNQLNEVKNDDENKKPKIFLNNKLKSIFQTEKQIKSHNLLTERINDNKNLLDRINNDMAQEIYNIKKVTLNTKKKEDN